MSLDIMVASVPFWSSRLPPKGDEDGRSRPVLITPCVACMPDVASMVANELGGVHEKERRIRDLERK